MSELQEHSRKHLANSEQQRLDSLTEDPVLHLASRLIPFLDGVTFDQHLLVEVANLEHLVES